MDVLIASALWSPELARRIAEADRRVELIYEPELLPPPRWQGDIAGDPGFRRDEEGERRWQELLGRAEVLFGMPGGSADGLVEAVRAGTRLRWVQARNAGAGEQVAQAIEQAREELSRVIVTTSSGVHGGPLAEFALLGLLAFAKRLPQRLADQRRASLARTRRSPSASCATARCCSSASAPSGPRRRAWPRRSG